MFAASKAIRRHRSTVGRYGKTPDGSETSEPPAPVGIIRRVTHVAEGKLCEFTIVRQDITYDVKVDEQIDKNIERLLITVTN